MGGTAGSPGGTSWLSTTSSRYVHQSLDHSELFNPYRQPSSLHPGPSSPPAPDLIRTSSSPFAVAAPTLASEPSLPSNSTPNVPQSTPVSSSSPPPPLALEKILDVTKEWWANVGEGEGMLQFSTVGPDGNVRFGTSHRIVHSIEMLSTARYHPLLVLQRPGSRRESQIQKVL